VLNCTQIVFTKDTEDAIQNKGLKLYYQTVNSQIMDLVDTVRMDLSPLEMKNISPLIVQGVHERDIIMKLETNEISSVLE